MIVSIELLAMLAIGSLYVTEQSHSSQCPVVRVCSMCRSNRSAQLEGSDVCQVCATWFFVHWTHVCFAIFSLVSGIDGIYVSDW